MTTYADLVSDIKSWAPSMTEFESAIPGIIRLAEAEHAQDMWILPMLIRSRALAGNDPESGDRFFPLPIDYLGMEELHFIKPDKTRQKIKQVSPSALIPQTTSSGQPEFCIHQEIELSAPLSDDQVLEMLYYRKFEAIGPNVDTNWLLKNQYNVYLYACLFQAFLFLRDLDTSALWGTQYERTVDAIMEKNRRSKWTQSEMSVSMNSVIDETP